MNIMKEAGVSVNKLLYRILISPIMPEICSNREENVIG